MLNKALVLLSGLYLLFPVLCTQGQIPKSSAGGASRAVAVTFDDLPIVQAPAGQGGCNAEALRDFTRRFVGKIAALDIPALGFVTEFRICDDLREHLLPELLTMWLDAGLELGNHTFSHQAFEKTPLPEFKADVIRGEATTAKLLRERGKRIRYFRYPFLHITGDSAKKAAFEQFLRDRGYTVAPVTFDSDEWIYAKAYAKAIQQGDSALMRRIGEDYLRFMEEIFEFNEQFSRELLGYELNQILLLHANPLNGDYLDELVMILKRRGYEFITIEEALEDPAYSLPDPYLGPRGLSWLQRLAVGKEGKTRHEPMPSKFVQNRMR